MNSIYTEDDKVAIDTFVSMASNIQEISNTKTFLNAQASLDYAAKNTVDIAFLDINLPDINGIELAEKLIAFNPNTHIVFVSGCKKYALDAFRVNAVDYLLKPYTEAQLARAVERAKLIMPIPQKKVVIRTIPHFDIFVDGELLPLKKSKPKELLALLVNSRGGEISPGCAICYLWENNQRGADMQSLYRMTFCRLRQMLSRYGIEFIISESTPYCVKPQTFECDLYDILNHKADIKSLYCGEYMSEYSWAETTNAQLYQILTSS